MAHAFYAVILSGGSGERFWPLSTPDRPKQFLTVFGGKSLIRQAVDRLKGVVPVSRVLVITAENLVPATCEELPELPRENVIAEPCRRDTAAAVATACGVVEARGGTEAVAAILTADHLMGNVKAFRRVLKDASTAAAKTANIITMGVAPTYPATGFGYIRVGRPSALETATTFFKAMKFVEKPDSATARRYLATGRYVWNAGMFVWRVATMKAALAAAPALVALEEAVAAARDVQPVLARLYPDILKISIDYAVMEKAKNILVSCSDFGWDDVGTWAAADRHLRTDARRNVAKGAVTLLDCENAVAVAEGPEIAALGVKDLVIVTTPDHVLVAAKDRVQDLKRILAERTGLAPLERGSTVKSSKSSPCSKGARCK